MVTISYFHEGNIPVVKFTLTLRLTLTQRFSSFPKIIAFIQPSQFIIIPYTSKGRMEKHGYRG